MLNIRGEKTSDTDAYKVTDNFSLAMNEAFTKRLNFMYQFNFKSVQVTLKIYGH